MLSFFIIFCLLHFANSTAPPMFGPGGLYECRCANGSQCKPTTGACPGACAPGYYNPSCQIKSEAYKKPASDYPNHPVHSAAWAVDGAVGTSLSGCAYILAGATSCTADPISWWQVDLNEIVDVSAVWLLNRNTGEYRLNDVITQVSATNNNWNAADVCSRTTPVGASQWYRGTCAQPIVGRFVRVEKEKCTRSQPQLQLCEVLVIRNFFLGVFISELTESRFQGELQQTDLYDSTLQYELTVEQEILSCSTSKQQVMTTTLVKSSTDFSYSAVKPYARYYVTVRPRRSSGEYIGGSDSVTFETSPSKPQNAPLDLKPKAVNSRNVTLEWSPLPCEYWNEQEIKYRIEMRLTGILVGNKSFTDTEALFSDLRPDKSYEAKIFSYNKLGFSQPKTIQVLTRPEAPSHAPTITGIKGINSTSFTVSWTALHDDSWNGPSPHYLVVVGKGNATVQHFNTSLTESTISNLQPYTIYNISIYSGNSVGYSSSVESSTSTAADIPSEPPKDLTASAVTARSAVLRWTAPPVNTWNGPNPHYRVHVQRGSSSIERFNSSNVTTGVSNLKPYKNYTVSVTSGNAVGYSIGVACENITTRPDNPEQTPTNISEINITSRSVQFSWTAPPADSWNGPNTYYHIQVMTDRVKKTLNQTEINATVGSLTPYSAYIVKIFSGNSVGISVNFSRWEFKTLVDFPTPPTKLKIIQLNDGRMLLSWKEPEEKNGVLSDYQVTCLWEKGSHNVTTKNTSTTVLNVPGGSNLTCHVAASTQKGFGVAAKRNFLAAPEPDSQQSQNKITMPLAISLPLLLVVAVVLAVAVLFIRRRRQNVQKSSKDESALQDFGAINKGTERSSAKQRSEAVGRPVIAPKPGAKSAKNHTAKPSGLSKQNKLELDSGSIPKAKFLEHVQQMKQNNSKGFKKEYEVIPENEEASKSAGAALHLKKKNRYKNILPYDQSRVTLQDVESDYVNASFIKGFHEEQQYIAAQAPTDESLPDFVQMLWQEKVQHVVMLNQVYENGKKRCAQYWPESKAGTVEVANFVVSLTDEKQNDHYVIRSLTLQKAGESKQQSLRQFHFKSWPDFGVPELCSGMLQLRQAVRPLRCDSPLLVHCSAGVGRTGTFIALDILLDCDTSFPVRECVALLRKYRMNMVQVEHQYIFLHEALLEAIIDGLEIASSQHLLQFVRSASFSRDAKRQFQVLQIVCDDKPDTDNALSEQSRSSFKELTFGLGLPVSCTLTLAEISDSTSATSALMAERNTATCVNHILQQPTGTAVVMLLADKTFCFPSKSKENENIDEMVYANLNAPSRDEVVINNHVLRAKEELQVTSCLKSAVLEIHKQSSSQEQTVYANVEESPTLQWTGDVFRFQTTAEDETLASASRSVINQELTQHHLDALSALLKSLQQNSNFLILFERSSAALVQRLLLSWSTVINYRQQQHVGVYNAAKTLQRRLMSLQAGLLLNEDAYCDAFKIVSQHLAQDQMYANI